MENFRNPLAPDPLAGFDAAADPADLLAGYDAATGRTAIPAGWYPATVARGELTTTRDGRLCYLLAFAVADGPHAGHRLYRRAMLDGPAAFDRAKAQLAPLGLSTSSALRAPYPPAGAVVRVKVLVTVREWQGQERNDVERVEVVAVEAAPANPFAVPLTGDDAGGRA